MTLQHPGELSKNNQHDQKPTHIDYIHKTPHGLANGPHTARLRVADRQNPLSTGHAVRSFNLPPYETPDDPAR
jgi:hypothetical protein